VIPPGNRAWWKLVAIAGTIGDGSRPWWPGAHVRPPASGKQKLKAGGGGLRFNRGWGEEGIVARRRTGGLWPDVNGK